MDPAADRDAMVDGLDRRRDLSEATLAALRSVPRHEFVPEQQRRHAYEDRPLPIGEGQTISAPHMVAIMTDLLAPDPGDCVLEIGTGCGYHAAVTAERVGDSGAVCSIEYHSSLAETARGRLDRLGYDVAIRIGDGHRGWPERAPYDAAYLTCAPERLPESVIEQVRPGGTVVGPVGAGHQRLVRCRRQADGSVEREDHGAVRFVPMHDGE